MDKLQHIRQINIENIKKRLVGQTAERLRRFYNKSRKRLFILDYDGTLSAFFQHPEDARPTKAILKTLELLSSDERNKIIISSGSRSRKPWSVGWVICLWIWLPNMVVFFKEMA
jgi:hypothetical protein